MMKSAGKFSRDNSSYIIRDPLLSPRPWINVLWNERTLAMINQFGCGESWHITPEGVRAGLCSGSDNRLVYVRDRSTGQFWAANRNYRREEFTEFHTEVGQGYSTVVSSYHGVRTDFKVFVPSDGPVECWTVDVENTRSKKARLNLFVYANMAINAFPFNAYKNGTFDKKLNGVFLACTPAKSPSKLTNVFLASEVRPAAWETSDRRFCGVYGYPAEPDALKAGGLASKETCFDKQMCAALQFDLTLKPGEKKQYRFIVGLAADLREARGMKRARLTPKYFDRELGLLRSESKTLERRIRVNTPDPEINAMANVWLKRQINLGKTWSRGGGRGFRDVMQDITAFVGLDAGSAAARIKHCLEHQTTDGNTLRQWDPDLLHPYRDGAAWIAPALASYMKETGDAAFLNEKVKYHKSRQTGTVLDHCRRGMKFLFSGLGAHGLCLWGGGDWNDSIDTAGLQGRGESVWLTEATIAAAGDFAEILERVGCRKEAETVRKRAQALTRSLLKHAWDKDHFICGFNDAGQRVGSYGNREGKVFLNMQTWAVLADVAKDGDALMDVVERKLSCPYGYVLNKPAYSLPDDRVGRLTYMVKGAYENGAVYNHAVAFKIAADCKLGRGKKAYETLKKILGSNPRNPSVKSGVEPYAVTNMFLGPENPSRPGESIVPWFTGTAGWLFRCIVESMIGVKADYDGLRIRPCLPPQWKNVELRREFRGSVYNIRIRNPHHLQTGRLSIRIDNKPYPSDLLPVYRDHKEHEVEVEIKR